MSASAPPPSDTANRPDAFERTVEVTHELRYLVSLPRGYETSADPLPLLLFLHGAGERGDDLDRVKAWGPPRLAEEDQGWRAAFPAIVVSPQCPEGQVWNTDTLLALLDHLEATHRVDPTRIYVTGLSMGGYGTWALADAAPGRFAAIAPVCGGYTYANIAARRRLGDMPVWAFHGDADDIIPVSETTDAIQALREQGADPDRVRMTIYEGVGHDAWRPAYAEDELWTWMLSQRRER
ncbi:MAG: prolyl oligopeptidase family serine peptidase [Planctomycetota bacterium]